MNDIKINILNSDDSITAIEAPCNMGLSLMELLKANEYNILATCGGLALCATCHVQILEGFEKLKEISNDEYAMLDTLPNLTSTSRLSCQLKISAEMNEIKVRVIGDGL